MDQVLKALVEQSILAAVLFFAVYLLWKAYRDSIKASQEEKERILENSLQLSKTVNEALKQISVDLGDIKHNNEDIKRSLSQVEAMVNVYAVQLESLRKNRSTTR